MTFVILFCSDFMARTAVNAGQLQKNECEAVAGLIR
jgi:hypothetical protein